MASEIVNNLACSLAQHHLLANIHGKQTAVEQMAQLSLNLSYLVAPSEYLTAGQKLWPPVELAAAMLSAPYVGALIKFLQQHDTGLLCTPLILTSRQGFEVYLLDNQGYFFRSQQGRRIEQINVELWLSAFCQFIDWLGGPVRTMQIDLPWYQDHLLPEYLQAWHVRVNKGSRFAVLRVPNQSWEQPLLRANEQIFAAANKSQLFVSQLRQQLLAGADLNQTSQALHVSSATLKRRIKQHGSSFRQQQQLMQAVLFDHGEHYLGLDKQGLLNKFAFHDRSTLNRACRRWFLAINLSS